MAGFFNSFKPNEAALKIKHKITFSEFVDIFVFSEHFCFYSAPLFREPADYSVPVSDISSDKDI